MTTEMVDKVATAICDAWPYAPDFADAKDAARAAIRALMEPTEEMYDAVWDSLLANSDLDRARARLSIHEFRLLFRMFQQAMLTAALGEDQS